MRDSSASEQLLELSLKNRHHLENIDTRIIVISNMCLKSASTETVRVVSDTRELIVRPFVFLKHCSTDFQSSYVRTTLIT